MQVRRSVVLAPALALTLVACSGGGGWSLATDTDGGPVAPVGPPTYWRDIAPILNDKCVKCHQAGGIAPFAFDGYEVAHDMSTTLAGVTGKGLMPPFLITHDGTCGQFDDAETLTAEQIARIDLWAAGDRPEGTRIALTPPAPLGLAEGRDHITPVLAPRSSDGSPPPFAEHRCFPLQPDLPADAFITASEVKPGNDFIVDAVLVFLVDPARRTATGKTNAEVMQALDRADLDRPGWPCVGSAGTGVEPEGLAAHWQRGQGPVVYPGRQGVLQKKTHQLVIQMNYSVFDPKLLGATDSTRVRLRYADAVDHRLVLLMADGFTDTLDPRVSPRPASLPPMAMSATYTWKKTGAQLGVTAAAPAALVGVMPHMNPRGRRQQLTLFTPDGKNGCAASIARWDVNWQKVYFYKGTPPRIAADTQVEVTCQYDTTSASTPVTPGWGLEDEACLVTLVLAVPG